jgi:DNA-binding SARP family transcriptional activator
VLEFKILGPLEVVGPEGPVTLGGQRPRALLALLLIHAGEVLSTDRIIEELWGEQPPANAKAGLHNFVAQLRRVLPSDVLVTRPPGYLLRIEPDQLDLTRFEHLVADARGKSAGQRSKMLREALALWRGPPLGEFAYESFAQGEIRRLEELRLEALEERIDADLEQGAGGELVGELEGLVTEHPLRERLCGQLMLSLYRAGRQAEGLQAYLDARRTLADELGIDPSPTLQQLYRSMLRQEAVLERTAPPHPVEDHLGDVVTAFLGGRLVFIVGTGVNHPGERAENGLPGPAEVASHLARSFDCPPDHSRDLAHVAEYVALTKGVGPLYDELHTLFGRDSAPGPVHRTLAELAGLLRTRGGPHQLIVTTNFDDVLEQAFRDAGEEFDVVSYLALGPNRGKFLHVGSDGSAALVDVPNAYTEISLERRPVILKIHGGIDRHPEREWESFVVSEDDHIDYLAQAEIAVVLPVTLAAKLRRSHFLFLGYPLHAWSLRVFLHRVWGRERVGYRSWAIGPQPEAIEQELWRQRGIDLYDVPLDEYVVGLASRIAAEVPT